MASKTTVELVDDLDGSPADETVRFGLDGKDLEIDLSAQHAGVLRDILSDYVAVGRKAASAGAGQSKQRAPKPGSSKEHLAAVRAWLRAQGHQVKDRGRISSDLMAKFDAAHAGTAAAPAREMAWT